MIQSIYFEITNVCYNSSERDNKKFIDPIILLSAIENSHLTEETTISLSGGEPFLHPDILYIIDMLSERNFKIIIVTNGLLLTKNLAMFLEKRNVGLQVSIDGTKDVHDYIRGKGTYDILINNLHILDRYYYMDKAIVKAVLTKLLLRHINEYVEEMIKLKFSNISFGYLSHSGRSKDLFYSQYTPNCEDLIKLDYEIDMAKKLYPDKVELPVICYSCGLLHSEKKEYNIRIDIDGNVYICQGFNDVEFSIGNILNETIEECIFSNKYHNLISLLRKRQGLLDCSRCILEKNSLCNKGCPAEEINLNGQQVKSDDKCKYRINRSLLDLVKPQGENYDY